MKAVHDNILQGDIKAEIAFVFSSREQGESAESDRFLRLVQSSHIPLVSFSYQRFRAARETTQTATLPQLRLEYDQEVMSRLSGFHPDLCVLAGYMLIVGEEMCRRYNMINLHPAAPCGPTGTWQEVIWQLIDTNAEQTGVMMHLVTPELDRGPVVAYCTFPIRGRPFDRYWRQVEVKPVAEIKNTQGENNPLFRAIRRHGLKREFPLIIATIRAFSQGRIKITENQTVVDADNRTIMGYDMTGEINRLI